MNEEIENAIAKAIENPGLTIRIAAADGDLLIVYMPKQEVPS